MNASQTSTGFLSLGPGAAAPAGRRLGMPVLAGSPSETLFRDLKPEGGEGGFELFVSGDWLLGWRKAAAGAGVGEITDAIYGDLLGLVATRGRHLARIWNYVPRINEDAGEGMEAYRVFCRARARAFDRAGWTAALPAASAVGGAPGELAVMFAAARERPATRENPEQVPAYEYPEDYGPRAPSFSRASQVRADGRRWTFVSGTAAIKGHVSMACGDLAGQIACTLDNLRLISRVCGLGETLGAAGGGGAPERHFKIYLRTPEDLATARAMLEGELLREGDRVSWLRSDICRRELLIEIEATVVENGGSA